jgi:hypothetical protein
MHFDKFSFGTLRIDGSTYEQGVVIDRGEPLTPPCHPLHPARVACLTPRPLDVCLHPSQHHQLALCGHAQDPPAANSPHRPHRSIALCYPVPSPPLPLQGVQTP